MKIATVPSLLLVALFPLIGCAHRPPAPPSPEAAALTAAIGHRLAYAPEVAWIKYLDGLPVRDPAREQAVLAAVSQQAPAHGLAPERVQVVFAAQIAASCAEQSLRQHLWRRGAPLPTYAPRSLAGGVRADIDQANSRLLTALARFDPAPPARTFTAPARRTLHAQGFSPAAVDAALAPWR